MARSAITIPGRSTGAERLPALDSAGMSAQQRRVAEAILSGPRGSMEGPFSAWLRSPTLADLLQRVGAYLRFETPLPPRVKEFAILVTAREWDCQFEWYAHHRLALEAGLEPQVAADLAAGRRPAGMQEDERIVYDFATELRRDRNVSDEVYRAAVAAFGEQGVVDLIALNGYYDLVSMTLNVAGVRVPEGDPPLPPLRR